MATSARMESDLRREEQALAAALQARDAAALARLLAFDYVFTSAGGETWGRARAMADLADPRLRVEHIDVEIEHVITMGDAAVVIGRSDVRGSIGEQSLTGVFRFTHAWRRSNSLWQLVAGHTSLLSPGG